MGVRDKTTLHTHIPPTLNFCGAAYGCGSSNSHIFPKLKPFNLSPIVRVPNTFTSDANVTGTLKFCRPSDLLRIKSSGIRMPDNVPPMFNDFLNTTLSASKRIKIGNSYNCHKSDSEDIKKIEKELPKATFGKVTGSFTEIVSAKSAGRSYPFRRPYS